MQVRRKGKKKKGQEREGEADMDTHLLPFEMFSE